MRPRPVEAVGVVVRVPARDDGTDPPREVVEDRAARLEQPEAREQPTRGVAVAVPAEKDATVTESVSGTGIASGDEAVRETASEVKTLSMATDARAARAGAA